MPDSFSLTEPGLFGKGKDMAKATAKVPTTGKEDLSGWEKKVYIAAPSINFIKIRFAPRESTRWAVGRSQGIVSECHTRPPAYQTPRRAGLLLFIAAVLI